MKKVVGYFKPVFAMCAFLMIVYGAYTPSQKADFQQVFCVKFKQNMSPAEVDEYMKSFNALRHDIPEIVSVTSGEAVNKDECDVMHYLTFRTKEGIEAYENSSARKVFFTKNQSKWQKSFTIVANIER